MAHPSPFSPRIALFLGACALVACGDGNKGSAPPALDKLPPARLELQGYLYARPDADDVQLIQLVRDEVSSVFTGLRRSKVMVTRRDVENADPTVFLREAVMVVDPETGARTLSMRVRYRYVARPEIAHDLVDKKEIRLAVLQRADKIDVERVLRDCTGNTERDKGYASSINLIFDGSLPRCQEAADAEQAAIDAARKRIAKAPGDGEGDGKHARDDDSRIPREEHDRLYLPVVVKLERRNRDRGEVAPRYVPIDETAPPPTTAQLTEAEDEFGRKIAPATVIVDPDAPAPSPQAGGNDPAAIAAAPAAGVGRIDATEPAGRLPQVVGPAAVAPVRKEQPPIDHFEMPLETLADPKFIVVWLSLLMAYPILRTDPRNKKQG